MYVKPICALLLGGKSTPATRAIFLYFGFWILDFDSIDFSDPKSKSEIQNRLSLPLLMLRVIANHAHDALAMDNLALIAIFLTDGRTFIAFILFRLCF